MSYSIFKLTNLIVWVLCIYTSICMYIYCIGMYIYMYTLTDTVFLLLPHVIDILYSTVLYYTLYSVYNISCNFEKRQNNKLINIYYIQSEPDVLIPQDQVRKSLNAYMCQMGLLQCQTYVAISACMFLKEQCH